MACHCWSSSPHLADAAHLSSHSPPPLASQTTIYKRWVGEWKWVEKYHSFSYLRPSGPATATHPPSNPQPHMLFTTLCERQLDTQDELANRQIEKIKHFFLPPPVWSWQQSPGLVLLPAARSFAASKPATCLSIHHLQNWRPINRRHHDVDVEATSWRWNFCLRRGRNWHCSFEEWCWLLSPSALACMQPVVFFCTITLGACQFLSFSFTLSVYLGVQNILLNVGTL